MGVEAQVNICHNFFSCEFGAVMHWNSVHQDGRESGIVDGKFSHQVLGIFCCFMAHNYIGSLLTYTSYINDDIGTYLHNAVTYIKLVDVLTLTFKYAEY